MNLIFRLIWISLTSRFRSRLAPTDEGRITLRVLPTDLDLNFHMNNGRYLSVADLGRVDLIFRGGLFGIMRRKGWYPVMGSIKITYLRSLNVFERYELTTRIVGWDDKWIYMVQRFERGGHVIAHGVMKTLFMSKTGRVSTAELAAELPMTTSPEIPADVLEATR